MSLPLVMPATPPLDMLCLLLRKAEDEVVAVFNKPILVSNTNMEHVCNNQAECSSLLATVTTAICLQ